MEHNVRMSRPERIRVTFWEDDPANGAIPLDLPARRMWKVSLILGAMFCIFAAIAWSTFVRMSAHSIRGVFDLTFVLFEGFWLLGWSVAVLILGTLTILFLFYRESARLQNGRLVRVPQLGPLKVIVEYDLAHVRNVRYEKADADDHVRVYFDYRGGTNGIGDVMSRDAAQRLVDKIQGAAAAAGLISGTTPAALTREAPGATPPKTPSAPQTDEPAPSVTSLSGLALIAANLLPLIGVLFFGWDLPSVLVLFWAESAAIGFFTILKIAIVAKLGAIFAVPFFLGHFGGFMTLHLGFIYGIFIRGIGATGPDPDVWEGLRATFEPVWISLIALFISHGVSFVTNFLGRREYERAHTKALMSAPYNRIIAMQFAIILGGWIIITIGDPRPALAILIVVKTVIDLAAHRKEHQPTRFRATAKQV